ncbi:polysaccharide pyruvyl transferase family protein [Microvirga sp. VF16]|uniref:polysaccharide pyruvyl transferase family protein n=1 Tax=Microvirga sp. VF16 TaxID=2807101 RepID=UPI00193D6983|nr:polysaccharide pyruvyl transferase family protein [Microvirga sp. VF16]QRM32377.1 polysaccharide pyruvyl transferase family protein [Microvirga sp. VF16]
MSHTTRICFGWRPGNSLPRPEIAGLPAGGLPRSADPTYGALARDFRRTGNKGYIVVGEATARLFACDREASAFVDLPALAGQRGIPALAEAVSRAFDMIVLPTAYEIAPGRDFEPLVRLLERLDVPVVTLGLGMNDDGLAMEDLHPSLRQLLSWLNTHAALFGVRADRTAAWLHDNGLRRAVALGCPSLHLYPDAIARLQPLQSSPAQLRIATGGYVLRDHDRAAALSALLDGQNVSYFVQDEIFHPGLFAEDDIISDDTRGILRKEKVEQAITDWGGFSPSFNRYFYFDALDTWRQAMAGHDVFIGDRFHGGTVALQVGLPTVMFTRDVRADELSRFYGIPQAGLGVDGSKALATLIAEALSAESLARFKATFAQRDVAFWDAMASVGLIQAAPRAAAA